jgi:hypothetical protein
VGGAQRNPPLPGTKMMAFAALYLSYGLSYGSRLKILHLLR